MKKSYIIFIISSLILFFNFIVCGPPKTTDEKADCYPSDLNIDVNSNTLDVSWVNDCEKSIAGYNIYINDEPLTGKDVTIIEPHNTDPFPGDTNPDDGVEHYIADGLDNGKKYFVTVRVINPDRTLSKSSIEKVAVCGPRGEIELSIRYKSSHDGYSFDKNEYVKADKLENDIYFFSKDGKDYLNSPLKLDGFLKANKLSKLAAKGDLVSAVQSIQIENKPDSDRLEVKKGDWLWILTPDDKSAIVNVLDIYGNGDKRMIKLYFAYSPYSGEVIF
jgi:hypothetical protein